MTDARAADVATHSPGTTTEASPNYFDVRGDKDLDTLYREAIDRVRALLRAGHALQVAWSGGKDSSALLTIALEGYRQAVRAGERVPPLFITHSNTGVENPVVAAYAAEQIEAIRAYADREALDVRVLVAKPRVTESWPVKVIGGRQLPTFVNSTQRRCTIDLKKTPSQRAMSGVREELVAAGWGVPVTLVGTRLDESAARSARMQARGDAADEIRETRDDRGRVVERSLSLIAEWPTDDVWMLLMSAGDGGDYPAYVSDFADTLEVYKDAQGGECVIVAAAAIEANRSACGARHGCYVCAAAGEDRSMQNMLTFAQHEWMAGLNRLQRWIVATQHDYSNRRWVGRHPDAVTGYVKIHPNAYNASTTEFLLRAALTLDVREQRRAQAFAERVAEGRETEDAGLAEILANDETPSRREAKAARYIRQMQEPRFQIITAEALVAIDYIWSRDALHPPHHALAIYDEVVNQGIEQEIPEVDPHPPVPVPEPRWLALERPRSYEDHRLIDLYRDSLNEHCGQTTTVEAKGVRVGADGIAREGAGTGVFERRLAVNTADHFTLAADGLALLFEFEFDEFLRRHEAFDAEWMTRTSGALHYLRLGVVSIAKGGQDTTERMTVLGRLWERHGLAGDVTLEDVRGHTIDDATHNARRIQARAHAPRVSPSEVVPSRAAGRGLDFQILEAVTVRRRARRELAALLPRLIAAESRVAAAVEQATRAPDGTWPSTVVEGVDQAVARRRYARDLAEWETLADERPELRLHPVIARERVRAYDRARRLAEVAVTGAPQFQWGFGLAFTVYDRDEQVRTYAGETAAALAALPRPRGRPSPAQAPAPTAQPPVSPAVTVASLFDAYWAQPAEAETYEGDPDPLGESDWAHPQASFQL